MAAATSAVSELSDLLLALEQFRAVGGAATLQHDTELTGPVGNVPDRPVASPDMSIDRVVVLHGYQANPARHWFGWLAEVLAESGIEVVVPLLPDPSTPKLQTWVEIAAAALGPDTSSTVVVGHSLGAVTALHTLERLGTPVAGYIAVAGFVELVPGISEVDEFNSPGPDLAATIALTGNRVVIHSENDPEVPPDLSRRLAAGLEAATLIIPDGGHFMGSEGFDALPELAALIRTWAAEARR